MVVIIASSFTFLLLLIINIALALATTSTAISGAKDGCKGSCGNVSVPYAFGIGPDCFLNSWFEVSCNESSTPPTILKKKINMEVFNFSYDLGDGWEYLRVKSPVILDNCSGRKRKTKNQTVDLTGSPFFFSSGRNKFIAAGCNNRDLIAGIYPRIVGCESTCNGDTLFGTSNPNKTCNGSTCCETVRPSYLQTFNARFESKTSSGPQGCKLAFVVDEEWLNFNITNPSDLLNFDSMGTTHESASIISSERVGSYGMYTSERSNISWQYFCRDGYRGNPYLPIGCQDIDECEEERHKISCGDATFVNVPGFYRCEGSKTWIIALGLGVGCGVLFLVMGGWWLYKLLKKRRKVKLKKKFFNEMVDCCYNNKCIQTKNTKIFTSKELDKATNNFKNNRVLGQGGQGTVYKGMLADGRIVAVKKSMAMVVEEVEHFINEVVILSQVNHRNVVKLLGCCLETEVPLLVYEFISNGTLFQYLHDKSEEFPLSWETRLRIAKETAEALWYLHSSASIPIYHRDIKSSNILLDEKFKAKVSDFGTSRSISIDQTHLTTHVHGTFGYLDPEYFQSSQFTEKSDVYSFGVVLVELLTGEKPIFSLEREKEGRSLATHFISSMEENRVMEIVDARVVGQAKDDELMMVAKLAYRCLSLSGKKRPTMKEVAIQLDQILPLLKDSNVDHHRNQEEIVHLKLDLPFPWDSTSSSINSSFFL
ncbi:wall-associated receptor kinase-like 22 [Gossypium australe]|uniref:Wall-associated receptor kinase-like 22 n=1 Tax=Gossypium australe TaxID=47621 RepID=A0A5B6VXA0_9ROSI|nr:wall-associated receptor kinase-like 22 [Gossypium australe]